MIMRLLLICYFFIFSFNGFAENYNYPFSSADRDPFVSLLNDKGELAIKKPAQESVADITLQGIMFFGNEGTVIINNDMYHTGDTIGKYKIIKIETNGITVTDNNQEHFIPWGG